MRLLLFAVSALAIAGCAVLSNATPIGDALT